MLIRQSYSPTQIAKYLVLIFNGVNRSAIYPQIENEIVNNIWIWRNELMLRIHQNDKMFNFYHKSNVSSIFDPAYLVCELFKCKLLISAPFLVIGSDLNFNRYKIHPLIIWKVNFFEKIIFIGVFEFCLILKKLPFVSKLVLSIQKFTIGHFLTV